VLTQGYQEWTVPRTGTYRIYAYGAQGGHGTSAGANGSTNEGGHGALGGGDFYLSKGDKLIMLVGQTGQGPVDWSGGGGGTFVTIGTGYTSSAILIGAGGGAGWNLYSRDITYSPNNTTNDNDGIRPGPYPALDALSSEYGNGGYGAPRNTSLGNGGTSSGSGYGANGGGFLSSGSYTYSGNGFRQGGAGGNGFNSIYGGFGGGGGGDSSTGRSGSGGGWTGGNASVTSGTGGGIAGGGGTYVNQAYATNIVLQRDANWVPSTQSSAHGYVTVTYL
jgi:hypothetical protein